MKNRRIASAISVVGFGLLFYASQNAGQGGGASGTSGATTPAPAQRQYITQSCREVAHTFGARSQLSELQQDELWRQYDDKWARWTVRAGEVSETFGQLSVQFKCGTESLLFDGHAKFPDSARAQLLTVRTGSTVSIECRLDDHGQLLGLSLEDCELH